MGGIKKLRIGSPEVVRALFNKMLEKHGVDYDYVMANQEVEGRLWCSHYSWTQEESDAYQKWWIDFFYNNVTPKRTKRWIKLQWPWYNLMYGLRIKE